MANVDEKGILRNIHQMAPSYSALTVWFL